MDPFNKAQTDKVWQRVLNRSGGQTTGEPPGSAPSTDSAAETVPQLMPMLEQAQASAMCYLVLSRRTNGRGGPLLRRLYEEKQNQADCLAGLYVLLYGKRPAPRPAKPSGQEPLEAALRRCYGAEMHLLASLERAAGIPEYSPVFKRLAQQTWEHCRLILELLGRSGRMQ